MKISYVIGFRNREPQRLWNCVESLMNQDYPEVEIIVSIFGGENMEGTSRGFLHNNTNVKVIYVETSELWNRGKCLNLGIKQATGDIIVCTDVDMIFDPTVARKTVDLMEEDMNYYLYANLVMMRKEDYHEGIIANFELEQFVHHNNKFTMVGTGGYQCMSKFNWWKLNGYKHCYVGWGVEDVDLFKRARTSQPVRLLEDVTIVHQWHESEISKAKREENKELLNAISKTNILKYGEGTGDMI